MAGAKITLHLAFVSLTALHAQSFDLTTEKEKIATIETAAAKGDDPTFVRACDELLDPHRINALAWYLCGKHLLMVKESDPARARAHTKTAYKRLEIAAADFARTGKQVYFALDAWQYLGLAALLLGDLDRAEMQFRRVLARDNRMAAAWYNLGVVYEHKGLRDESMRAFDRYLRLQRGGSALDF